MLHKRRRYDPSEAKKQSFYTKAKHFKSYQRLLKKEGYSAAQPSTLDDEGKDERAADQAKRPQPYEDSERRRRRVGDEGAREEEAGEEPEVKDAEAAGDVEQERPRKRQKKEVKAVKWRKSAEEVQAEKEARQRALAASREARLQSFKRHVSKTRKGQPVSAAVTSSTASRQ